jgi:hypothetical protein
MGQTRAAESMQFVVRLFTTHMREVRSSSGRAIQLMWDRLSELLGEQGLIDHVGSLPMDDRDSCLD